MLEATALLDTREWGHESELVPEWAGCVLIQMAERKVDASGACCGTYELNATDAAGTSFEGGPATIPSPSATVAVSATLPTGSLSIYTTVGGSDPSVVVIPHGSGEIILMGWDWFNAAPVGTEDGGWLDVLSRATAF